MNYEIKNKGLHLVKADINNFRPLAYVCQEKGCPSSFIIFFVVETCIGLV